MAVTFRSVGTSPGAASGNCIIVKPAGLAVGDLMIAHVGFRVLTLAITPPNVNWAQPQAQRSNPASPLVRSGVFWKIADAADVAATNFTFTGSISQNFGKISAYYGHNAANPIDSSGSNQYDVTTSVHYLNDTIFNQNVTNCVVVGFIACPGVAITGFSNYYLSVNDPGGWVEPYDSRTGSAAASYLALGSWYSGERAATGSIGRFYVDSSAAAKDVGFVLLIAPDPPSSSSSSSTPSSQSVSSASTPSSKSVSSVSSASTPSSKSVSSVSSASTPSSKSVSSASSASSKSVSSDSSSSSSSSKSVSSVSSVSSKSVSSDSSSSSVSSASSMSVSSDSSSSSVSSASSKSVSSDSSSSSVSSASSMSVSSDSSSSSVSSKSVSSDSSSSSVSSASSMSVSSDSSSSSLSSASSMSVSSDSSLSSVSSASSSSSSSFGSRYIFQGYALIMVNDLQKKYLSLYSRI